MEIKLVQPRLKGEKSVEECIFERESVRKFWDKEIEPEKLSLLLWAVQGKKSDKRTAPSAGAVYPLEIFVILKKKGLFYYDINNHSLILKKEGDIGKELASAAWNQEFIEQAPLILIILANFSKIIQRYSDRGVKYAIIEVGHCAQNVHLEAVSLELGSVPIGAFEDKKVKKLLELQESLDPIYIIPIGYPK